MESAQLATYLDATVLKPETQPDDLRAFIDEAAAAGVYAVCFSPSFLPFSVPEPVKTAVVIGFPSGKHRSTVKAAEAAQAVADGADELDMVIDIAAAIRHDFGAVERDIRAVRDAAPAPTVLKVILETATLDRDAIEGACLAAERAGADFVKTSTGFHPAGGATLEAVQAMADAVGGRLGVKASGGIRDRETALAMIEAGATRLGVSSYRALLGDAGERTADADDAANGAANPGLAAEGASSDY